MTSPANPRFYAFIGGNTGAWSVTLGKAVTGEPLPTVNRLDILNSDIAALPDDAQWMLRGVTSNERYVTPGSASRTLPRLRGLMLILSRKRFAS